MIKKLSEILFGQKVYKQKQLAYLVKSNISIIPQIPPIFQEIDLTFIAKHSLRIIRAPSELDQTVCDVFNVQQFNIGSYYVNGLIFLELLRTHEKFNIKQFKYSIGLPYIDEQVIEQVSSESEFAEIQNIKDIQEPMKCTVINNDLSQIYTQESQLANLIEPGTNIFGEYHVFQLQKCLNILKLKDCSICYLVDILDTHEHLYTTKLQNTTTIKPFEYTIQNENLLLKIRQLLYHDVQQKSFTQNDTDMDTIINTIISIRTLLESNSNIWPGQKSLLQLSEKYSVTYVDQNIIFYINHTFKNIFPILLPINFQIYSFSKFLQLLQTNGQKISQFGVQQFLKVSIPTSLTKDHSIRNEFHQLLDMNNLAITKHHIQKFNEILQKLFNIDIIPYPLTYFYTFSQFYTQNLSKIQQMKAIEQNSVSRTGQCKKLTNQSRYDLQFDRLLYYLNNFYNLEFNKQNKHISSITQFARLLDDQFGNTQGNIALENQGINIAQVLKRAETIYYNEYKIKGHYQPLITSMISKIFTDFTFVGSQRSANLLLQIQNIFQSNKIIYQLFNDSLFKWFKVKETIFPLFFLYSLFLELKQNSLILKDIIESQQQIDEFNLVLQEQLDDETIVLKKCRRFSQFLQNRKSKIYAIVRWYQIQFNNEQKSVTG